MVQKKIFEAGLGDVDVAKLDAGSSGEVGDLGNKRAAAVGVEIGAVAVGGADFPDAGQALETLQKFRGMNAESEAATSIRREQKPSAPAEFPEQ